MGQSSVQCTFVSGLETLYVAGCIILLHSHLLAQRLGSHSINNAIANLKTQTQMCEQTSGNVIVSFLPCCTCFACCLRLSFTVSGSTLFHSAAMQRNTSAPPFSTWQHTHTHTLFIDICYNDSFVFHRTSVATDLQQTLILGEVSQHSQLQLGIICC